MTDTFVDEVTVDLVHWSEFYDGRYMVCESITFSAAKKISEAFGWEFQEDGAPM
jgi:hypothetical protein